MLVAVAGAEIALALITPLLIVIVEPSTLTPPKTPNELMPAVGNVYVLLAVITPLPLIVILVPSILTPPRMLVVAVGNV